MVGTLFGKIGFSDLTCTDYDNDHDVDYVSHRCDQEGVERQHVPSTNTLGTPGTVVVHFINTHSTIPAVLDTRPSEDLALITEEFPESRVLCLLC